MNPHFLPPLLFEVILFSEDLVLLLPTQIGMLFQLPACLVEYTLPSMAFDYTLPELD